MPAGGEGAFLASFVPKSNRSLHWDKPSGGVAVAYLFPQQSQNCKLSSASHVVNNLALALEHDNPFG